MMNSIPRYRGVVRGLVCVAIVCVLGGCSIGTPHAPMTAAVMADEAVPLPILKLQPSLLARPVSAQQRLQIIAPDGSSRQVDALLEADHQSLRLALTQWGQVLASMYWDGKLLQVQRSRHLPQEVDPERVLSDLQLALWPVHAVQAALTGEWHLQVLEDGTRQLFHREAKKVEISWSNSSQMEITYQDTGWKLQVSTPAMTHSTMEKGTHF